MRNLALVGALLVGAFLMAAAPPPVDDLVLGQAPCAGGTKICIGSKNVAVKVDGPIELDGRGGRACDGGTGLCFTGKGSLAWDFVALTNTSAAMQTICIDSDAGSAPGCLLGDQVLLGSTASLPATFGTLQGFISSDEAFKVRACATGLTDAGTFDMPDSVFKLRCFR
jgi:hypothetical protein